KDGPEPKDPIPARAVATQFLMLAVSDKPADALKLTVPGTISENKVGEIRKAGYAASILGPTFNVVLINDTRVEVVSDRQFLTLKGNEKTEGHIVLMLTKSKDGAWQVKDIDARDPKRVEDRVKLYLGGEYDEKEKK